MWKKVEKQVDNAVSDFFFSGSAVAKLDEKNRFVIPQAMRYGLVENGKLEFTIALGLGGCLTIYRPGDIQRIIKKFREKQHQAKFQKFFTLFFSTLHQASCDKLGRTILPSLLRSAVSIKKEIVVAGVLDKIELWPKEAYDENLKASLSSGQAQQDLKKMAEDAFALLSEEEKGNPTEGMQKLTEAHIPAGSRI